MLKYLSILIMLVWGNLASQAQTVRVVKFSELKKTLSSQADTLYVVNFWATWCKPCVMELPYFEKAHQEFKQQKVKILLVSLDFESDLNTKLKPFVKRKNLQSSVWLLNETDYNSFIDQVDTAWQGALPATVIFNNARKQHQFIDKELKENQLKEIIMQHLAL